MKFLTTAEAAPLRIQHAWERGIAFLERGECNRAWLAARTICLEDPDSVPGNLLYALANERKSKLLKSPYFLAACRPYCEKVLAREPENAEAGRILRSVEALEKSGVDLSFATEYDEFLGRAPVAFKDCQIGYHPESIKNIIIWTLADQPEGNFSIIDAVTGECRLTGGLTRHGRYAWNRWWWSADFSSFTQPGIYLLRVLFPDATAESQPFEINRDVYLRMQRLSLQGFFHHRCGQRLPWRDGCNDGPIIYDSSVANGHRVYYPDEDHLARLPRAMDIRKGWHDGGNWERHSTNMITNLYCLLLAHELAPRDWRRLGGPLPDALEEARYAVEFFLSALDENGNANVSTHVIGIREIGDGRAFLTQLYLSFQDAKIHLGRRHPGRSAWIPWYTRLFAAGLARFALLIRPEEPAFAAECIAAAGKMHTFYREPDPGEKFTMSVEAALALSALHLGRFAGDSGYLREARGRIENVLRYQDADGFFPASGVELSAIYLAGFFPQIALYEYAAAFPDDALTPRIKKSFESYMPWLEKLTGISPFGHLMEYAREKPRNLITAINGHGTNAYFGYAAVVCLLANRLLQTGRYTEIAERQVQWLFGRNPAGVSFMGGSGYRSSSQHLNELLDNALGLKQIPGFMPLGLRGVKIEGLADDYPLFWGFDMDGYGQGYSISWANCEGGGMTEGPTYAALALLTAVRDQ